MAEAAKDTIYVDVDDEITTVIDKVMSSDKSIVALVLPKRASVFQSIVNMRLLKRQSEQAKKNIVLITTESGLLPLAGAAGIHVAKTLASKPEIPDAPSLSNAIVEADEDEPIELGNDEKPDIDLKKAADEPIGKLASDAEDKPIAPTAAAAAGIETIELDNEVKADEEDKPNGKSATKPKKSKKDKSLKVPNFEKFRLLLILGGLGVILLIVLLILAAKVFPKATIDIQTDAANVNTNVSFNLSTTAKSLNPSTNTVPAKQVTETKTYTGTANASGQENNGQKATGTVMMKAQECAPNLGTPTSVPAGTGITSGGDTYITQQSTVFSPLGQGHGSCETYTALSNTDITAQNGGSNYNTSGNANFSVPGRSDIDSVTGSANGGTDDIVTVVSQADIINAENKVSTDNTGAKSDLSNQLNQAGYYPIGATFSPGTPSTSPSASAGTAANSVTVTETIIYTMYGAHSSDIKQLIDSNINSQVSANQNILDDGFNSANFSVGASSPTSLTVQTTAEVGPDINAQSIKTQAEGKKSADIMALVKQNPDVTNVTVHFSPFYVSSAPSSVSKITVNIAKPTTTKVHD